MCGKGPLGSATAGRDSLGPGRHPHPGSPRQSRRGPRRPGSPRGATLHRRRARFSHRLHLRSPSSWAPLEACEQRPSVPSPRSSSSLPALFPGRTRKPRARELGRAHAPPAPTCPLGTRGAAQGRPPRGKQRSVETQVWARGHLRGWVRRTGPPRPRSQCRGPRSAREFAGLASRPELGRAPVPATAPTGTAPSESPKPPALPREGARALPPEGRSRGRRAGPAPFGEQGGARGGRVPGSAGRRRRCA